MPDAPALDDRRWSHDVVLADGTTARVRPISPDDGTALVAFHERQSRESIYYRFFSPRPHLSESDVAHFTTVDGSDRMAFVAVRGDDLLGVARFDRYGHGVEAEAAFFTDDEMAGRGIATILLEYLAAYAREVGITRFVAHVLPENRRMTSVFRAAGFGASTSFQDGVIEVSMGIEPTEESLRAIAARERAAERHAIRRLLEPRTVAVVGAGRDPDSLGHRLLRNLLSEPFAGTVYPVHPEAESVAGVRAVPNIEAIDDPVDLAVLAVPAAEVLGVVEACGRARVGAVVVIAAGFAESGPEGRAAQDRVVATARRFGMRVLGPNCMGVRNTDPAVRLHATFADVACRPGAVGVLSQSGTFGAAILAHAERIGMGVSSFVSVGNKADLSGNDLLQYWLDDDRTRVVALYLESFGNPRRFGRNVRRVARIKPVFAVQSGTAVPQPDPSGADTGWLDDHSVDALLRQTGVVRVPSVRALLDVALLASNQPVPAGSRVAVVGNSGASVVLAADACLDAGLVLADPGPAATAVVDEHRLHGRAGPNPVELRYDAGADHYRTVLEALVTDESVDVLLVVHAPYARDEGSGIAAVLDEIAQSHPDRTIAACVSGSRTGTTPGGVPHYEFPDDAAQALGSYAQHRAWQRGEAAGSVLTCPDTDALADLVGQLASASGRDLDPEDARRLLQVGGVAPVPVMLLRSPDDLTGLDLGDIEGDVAVKAARHQTGAATRKGGVALDLRGRDAVAAAAADIGEALGDLAWPMLVQPMEQPGVDVAVSIETHPVVGAVVRVGPGGGASRYTEGAMRALPVSDRAARALVDESGLRAQLDSASRESLLQVVQQLAAIVDAAPEIVRLRCDPVIVRPDGVSVIEVQASISGWRSEPLPAVRRVDA